MVAPFRLLDLPQEVQDLIYEQHFASVSSLALFHLTAPGQASPLGPTNSPPLLVFSSLGSSSFPLPSSSLPLPSLAIERASRKVCEDAQRIRARLWPRTLLIKQSEGLNQILALLATRPEYKWICERVRSLVLPDTDLGEYVGHGTWKKLVRACTQLLNVEVWRSPVQHISTPEITRLIDPRNVERFTENGFAIAWTAMSNLNMRSLAKAFEKALGDNGGWKITAKCIQKIVATEDDEEKCYFEFTLQATTAEYELVEEETGLQMVE